MKVAVVAEYYPRRRDEASGIWAHRQALAVREAGADVRVFVLERVVPPAAAVREASRGRLEVLHREVRALAAQPKHDVIDGIPVTYVRFVSPARWRAYGSWHRWARRSLERALAAGTRGWQPDVVHAHYALPAGGAALGWAAAHRIPLAVSVHGGDVLAAPLQTPAARAAVGEVLRGAAQVMCNSRATLERAAALAGSDANMRVVHLGASVAEPAPAKHPEPTVATLAHVIPRKRHEDVLRAIAAWAELRWSVIGDGPELPRLRALADEFELSGRVDFHGQLAPDDALRELARCHVMALPSEDEAFGVAYAEALANGVPAIGCAGEGGPEEIATLGPGMVLVPPRDPVALGEAITATLEDADLSDAARRTGADHLSWERCAAETMRAYSEALGRG